MYNEYDDNRGLFAAMRAVNTAGQNAFLLHMQDDGNLVVRWGTVTIEEDGGKRVVDVFTRNMVWETKQGAMKMQSHANVS